MKYMGAFYHLGPTFCIANHWRWRGLDSSQPRFSRSLFLRPSSSWLLRFFLTISTQWFQSRERERKRGAYLLENMICTTYLCHICCNSFVWQSSRSHTCKHVAHKPLRRAGSHTLRSSAPTEWRRFLFPQTARNVDSVSQNHAAAVLTVNSDRSRSNTITPSDQVSSL